MELNRVKSNLQYLLYGVTQGFLLGPSLFSIYLKYFADNVSTVELHLNADDSTAFVVGDTIDQVSQLLNTLRSKICSWYELDRLTIHLRKCEPIPRRQFIGPLQPVCCGTLLIDFSKVVKSLGSLKDNKRLSWDIILINYPKRFSAQLVMLRKIRFLLTK